ncbi:hypothetical protein [Desulfosporosinus youngiae]|uniref:Uncharacterized protein n=1 Tax=Desulfosporosinus youngiae DSM 17734 TaxID=768710 RepID=H5XVD1_9FIRM|nr:hypothetical protein [Desulfosporosinus youngiae]EHQ89867.1 hypothetical protein DesyoDRAFT_2818 [Desulfosporosinus youngiae DSM 17734]
MRRYACLDSNKNITLLREVREDEYSNFASITRKFNDFLMEVDYYKVFDKPYKELINFLQKYLQKRSNFQLMDINRYTMNYLYGIRTFLDHWEARIKRKYRGNQQYLELFNKAKSQEYDNHMAYRIVYRLRNYVQHCEMPISNVTERLITDNKEEILVYVNRDRLLSNFKEWKPEEVAYLNLQEQQFEIMPLFIEMNNCLVRIQEQLINFNINKNFILDCVKVLKLRNQFQEYEGTLAIIEYADDRIENEIELITNSNTVWNIEQLPTATCENVIRMHIRNNAKFIKIFHYSGICCGETNTSFPYSTKKNENGLLLFVKGKDIVNVKSRNWIRLVESMSHDETNNYNAVYADARFGMKELKELSNLYSDICDVLYKFT